MGGLLIYAGLVAGGGFVLKKILGKRKPMSEEEAATKVQSIFRGHFLRKQQAEEKDAAVKVQAVYRGHAERKKLEEEKKATKSG